MLVEDTLDDEKVAALRDVMRRCIIERFNGYNTYTFIMDDDREFEIVVCIIRNVREAKSDLITLIETQAEDSFRNDGVSTFVVHRGRITLWGEAAVPGNHGGIENVSAGAKPDQIEMYERSFSICQYMSLAVYMYSRRGTTGDMFVQPYSLCTGAATCYSRAARAMGYNVYYLPMTMQGEYVFYDKYVVAKAMSNITKSNMDMARTYSAELIKKAQSVSGRMVCVKNGLSVSKMKRCAKSIVYQLEDARRYHDDDEPDEIEVRNQTASDAVRIMRDNARYDGLRRLRHVVE